MFDERTESVADVAVIGAGAAGLATAIFAARRMPERSIVALDGAEKLGAKILVSGGGRCNVTNAVVTPADFFGGNSSVIRRVLAAFTAEDAVAFFSDLGVELHVEEHGKLFPNTNQARTVLDALVGEATRRGVRLLTHHRVTDVQVRGDCFGLVTSGGSLSARRVVLATGGLSLPKTGSDGGGYELARKLGHTITATTPALAPLLLEGDFHVALSGVAHDVELTVHVEGGKPVRAGGAMLWSHFGVTGPAVLDVSRHWHRARLEGRHVTVSANLLPGCDFTAADRRLLELATAQPKVQLHNALAGLLPGRVADAILAKLGIDGATPTAHVVKDVRRKLAHALIAWPLPVRDSRGYKFAEMTAGGVPLSEIDSTTMASRKCPGLFLVGEILDVDGRIGGFNFQWAWSTGWVAAVGLCRDAWAPTRRPRP